MYKIVTTGNGNVKIEHSPIEYRSISRLIAAYRLVMVDFCFLSVLAQLIHHLCFLVMHFKSDEMIGSVPKLYTFFHIDFQVAVRVTHSRSFYF